MINYENHHYHHKRSYIGNIDSAKAKEEAWIQNSIRLLDVDTRVKGQMISWAAHHTTLQSPQQCLPAVTAGVVLVTKGKAASHTDTVFVLV